MRSALIATYLGTMPKTISNPIKGILGIESQIEEEMQAEKNANKKALVEANYNNTSLIEHTKQHQTITMTSTQNFLHLIQWQQYLW